jgi:hypothetical protein
MNENPMETHSGLPALSVAQREHYEQKRSEIFAKAPELRGCTDIHRIPIPYVALSFFEWRKRDIKSKIHPVQLALICGESSYKQEQEHRYEIESAHGAGDITDEQRDEFLAEVNQRRDSRLKALHGLMKE